MEHLEKYLNERIIHLKKVEMEYFDKSVDQSIGSNERLIYRRFSNEFCAARRECELTLEKLKGASKRSSNVVENEQSKEYCALCRCEPCQCQTNIADDIVRNA